MTGFSFRRLTQLGIWGIITSPVSEIEDFERVPENIESPEGYGYGSGSGCILRKDTARRLNTSPVSEIGDFERVPENIESPDVPAVADSSSLNTLAITTRFRRA